MTAGDAGLEGEVVGDAQARDQVELLKHQAQPVAPQRGPAGIGEVANGGTVQLDLAAIGAIEARDQMQQCALAAAGFPGQRDTLARGDVEVHAAEHRDLFAGGAIGLGQVPDGQHDLTVA